MVVFGLGKNILSKSMLGSCAPSNSPQSTSHETPFESIIISQQTPIETLNLSPKSYKNTECPKEVPKSQKNNFLGMSVPKNQSQFLKVSQF